jgi:hypothetical protein
MLRVDALVGAVVGGLIGGAFTWFVALRSADFGRRAALEVWERDQQARDANLRRALLAEVRANIAATAKTNEFAQVRRSAWDDAQALNFDDAAFETISGAYVAGDVYNGAVARLDRTMSQTVPGVSIGAQQRDMAGNAQRLNEQFRAALTALAPT